MGVPYFLDVPDWSKNAPKLHAGPNILSGTESEHTSKVAESEHVSEATIKSKDATKDEDSSGSPLL